MFSMQLRTCFHSLLLAVLFAGALPAAAGTFVAMNATYSGLFFETNNVWQQSAGALTLTTTVRSNYTARLQLGAERFAFSGQIMPGGYVIRKLLRHYEDSLTVQLQFDAADPNLAVGSVSTRTWYAELKAGRAVSDGRFNLSTNVGQYTMVIPGNFLDSTMPGGQSYGTITVTKAGLLQFAGVLADGTKVTQSTRLAQDSLWPLYASLYGGYGALYAKGDATNQWIGFNVTGVTTNEDLSGYVDWIRPEMPWTWYYPGGFAIESLARGMRYIRPHAGTNLLNNVTNLSFEFNGGELYQGITNRVTLDSRNRVSNKELNGLNVTFSLSNGSFSGRVMDPYTWEWIPFKGVVLQGKNQGAGFFPGWTQTGEVRFELPPAE